MKVRNSYRVRIWVTAKARNRYNSSITAAAPVISQQRGQPRGSPKLGQAVVVDAKKKKKGCSGGGIEAADSGVRGDFCVAKLKILP